jgi:hypothetical protein
MTSTLAQLSPNASPQAELRPRIQRITLTDPAALSLLGELKAFSIIFGLRIESPDPPPPQERDSAREPLELWK